MVDSDNIIFYLKDVIGILFFLFCFLFQVGPVCFELSTLTILPSYSFASYQKDKHYTSHITLMNFRTCLY